ncbi:hypothetical protein KAT36_00420 [Candidatus Pacearchaeota archaeon]|nr:hypothetical protein [Candidatus Pacearchaeota archaeon]
MRIIEDCLNELKLIGAPRPYYLFGKSKIYNKNGEDKVIANAMFPSFEPSIGDRWNSRTPHVNLSNAYFALWNTVHLLGNEIGFYDPLSTKGNYKPIKLLPADKNIQLEMMIKDIRPSQKMEGYDLEGKFMGKFLINDELYLVLSGKGIGKSR